MRVDLTQVLPRVETGVVTVIEEDAHGVVADEIRARCSERFVCFSRGDHRERVRCELFAKHACIGRWRHATQERKRKERRLAALPLHDESLMLSKVEMLWSVVRGHVFSVEAPQTE